MENNYFNNKSILFVAPIFFDHHKTIMKELYVLGADVKFVAERPNQNLFKLFNFLHKKFGNWLNENHLNKIFSLFKKNNFDYVFVIRAQIFTNEFMQKLRKEGCRCRFILYQWDSIVNNNYLHLIQYFDKVYSFDSNDCSNNSKINYLPLFYGNEYKNIRSLSHSKYDIVYIGQYISERNQFIEKIKYQLDENNLNYFFYEYINPLKYVKKKYLQKEKIANISFRKLTRTQIINIYKDSFCILDMPSPKQSGLTMRTFECLGGYRKLVTTNNNIATEPFFDKNIIYIINSDNPMLDINFVKKPFIKSNIIDNYSINNWLGNIFNENT